MTIAFVRRDRSARDMQTGGGHGWVEFKRRIQLCSILVSICYFFYKFVLNSQTYFHTEYWVMHVDLDALGKADKILLYLLYLILSLKSVNANCINLRQ